MMQRYLLIAFSLFTWWFMVQTFGSNRDYMTGLYISQPFASKTDCDHRYSMIVVPSSDHVIKIPCAEGVMDVNDRTPPAPGKAQPPPIQDQTPKEGGG